MTPSDRERLDEIREHDKALGGRGMATMTISQIDRSFLLRLLTEAERKAQRLDTQLAQCAVTVANLETENALLRTEVTALEITRDRLRKALEAAPIYYDDASLPTWRAYRDWYDTVRKEALK